MIVVAIVRRAAKFPTNTLAVLEDLNSQRETLRMLHRAMIKNKLNDSKRSQSQALNYRVANLQKLL